VCTPHRFLGSFGEREELRGPRERPRPLRIFATAHSRLYLMRVGTQGAVRDVAHVDRSALIFVAAVVVMVALAVWMGL
jgi:hypothetical protein